MIGVPRTGAARAGLVVGACALGWLKLVSLEACAHAQAPMGGPADSTPPLLIAIEPDSYAVVPGFEDQVRFQFDESISERSTQGTVTLYPLDPRPRVGKGKRELRVRPGDGWVADRIYHLRIEPNVQDLFNNRIPAPILYVFSTGAPIPANRVRGTVIDRINGQPLRTGRVDMIQLPDTLRYGAVADSAGLFGISALPEGEYLAIGFEDVNNNRRADDFDRSDTARVTLGTADTLTLAFRVFRHDTVGPRLTEARPIDSVTVELQFDGYLDPEAPLSVAQVELFAVADSAPVALDTVLHGWQFAIWRDSLQRARAGARDTLEAAADTLGPAAVPVDTAAPAPPGARPPREGAPPLAQEAEGPLPERSIYIVARARIPPRTQAVRVRRLLNLSGLEGGGEASFEPVEPEPEQEPPPPPPPPPQGRGPGEPAALPSPGPRSLPR